MNVEAILARLVGFMFCRSMPWLGLCQQAGIDTISCDPGDIRRAHRSNEYIETDELAVCQQMIEHLAA